MLDGEGLQPSSDTETLVRILGRTASLLQARGCGVFIWDKDKNQLSAMRPFFGVEDGGLKSLEFPVSSSAMGSAVLQDRPVLMDETSNGHPDEQALRTLDIQNAVSVPLAIERRDEGNMVVERSIMGVFCAFDKFYGRKFDLEDAKLLSMMARQASAVLVTSQLYWKEVERTKRLHEIFKNTSVGLMAISPKGTVTQINPAAQRALSMDPDGWFGKSYEEVISNREICEIIGDAQAGNPSAEPKELTLYEEAEDGERDERIYRIQTDPIRSEDGEPMGWVIVFENITDIRRGEQMMAAFVDMVSHELRTPLTPIRGFVSTLLQAGEGMFDWETQAEFLQIVDTEAERLGVLIDDLLNIARIQNGRGLQFHFTPTNLHSMAEQVVRLQAQSSYKKPTHTLAVDIPDGLVIQADEGKLIQILHNLVGNALKYSPDGGEVKISAVVEDDGVKVGIHDQGLGIPPDALPKMFGQFFRVESSGHTGIKGTGLGLWLTKYMVEGHTGRIWVESEWGQGSVFYIWLPKSPSVKSDD
ncbi:MAG: ATP-binding protein [Armatimonadota bacterium]